jgi:hypothetical protein
MSRGGDVVKGRQHSACLGLPSERIADRAFLQGRLQRRGMFDRVMPEPIHRYLVSTQLSRRCKLGRRSWRYVVRCRQERKGDRYSVEGLVPRALESRSILQMLKGWAVEVLVISSYSKLDANQRTYGASGRGMTLVVGAPGCPTVRTQRSGNSCNEW